MLATCQHNKNLIEYKAHFYLSITIHGTNFDQVLAEMKEFKKKKKFTILIKYFYYIGNLSA